MINLIGRRFSEKGGFSHSFMLQGLLSGGKILKREDTESQLKAMLEPLLEKMGFELVDLEYYPGKQGKVFLCIDCSEGITIDHCEAVSRAVSSLLDREDPLPHAYLLEVASPGPERPLTKKNHFERFVGEHVKVIASPAIEGQTKFAGKLRNADQDAIIIEKNDGSNVSLQYDQIKKAHLWYKKPDKSKN